MSEWNYCFLCLAELSSENGGGRGDNVEGWTEAPSKKKKSSDSRIKLKNQYKLLLQYLVHKDNQQNEPLMETVLKFVDEDVGSFVRFCGSCKSLAEFLSELHLQLEVIQMKIVEQVKIAKESVISNCVHGGSVETKEKLEDYRKWLFLQQQGKGKKYKCDKEIKLLDVVNQFQDWVHGNREDDNVTFPLVYLERCNMAQLMSKLKSGGVQRKKREFKTLQKIQNTAEKQDLIDVITNHPIKEEEEGTSSFGSYHEENDDNEIPTQSCPANVEVDLESESEAVANANALIESDAHSSEEDDPSYSITTLKRKPVRGKPRNRERPSNRELSAAQQLSISSHPVSTRNVELHMENEAVKNASVAISESDAHSSEEDDPSYKITKLERKPVRGKTGNRKPPSDKVRSAAQQLSIIIQRERRKNRKRLAAKYIETKNKVLHPRTKVCDICSYKTRVMPLFENHLRDHETKEINLKCPDYEGGFTNKQYFDIHLRRHSFSKQCDICNESVITLELKTHIEKHHGKVFSCQYCDYNVGSFKNLINHVSIHPSGKLRCEHCPDSEMMSVQKGLVEHLYKFHEEYRGDIAVQCDHPECSAILLRTQLTVHSYSHSKQFQCDLCHGRKFSTSNNLNLHVSRIHKMELRHECDQCSKKFCSKEALKSHKRKEHDMPLLECEICPDKKFLCLDGLRDHNKQSLPSGWRSENFNVF